MKKIILGLIALVILAIAGVGIAILTVDPDKYRAQIADVLSKQTGRTVELKGPIHLGLSLDGVTVSIQDASISNPAWASRPQMAGIGTFELGVALMPLLHKQLIITQVKVANADIMLETSGAKHNWDMTPVAGTASPTATPQAAASSTVAISVDKVSVTDSQIAMRDADGKTSTYKVKALTLGRESGGLAVHFTGDYNGAPITVAAKTSLSGLMDIKPFTVDMDVTYATFHIQAKGHADLGDKKADFSNYNLTAGGSDIHGQLSAHWGGAKPDVSGTVLSNHLDPASFALPSNSAEAAPGAKDKPAPASTPMFSDAPLPLDGLRAADARFSLALNEVVLSKGTLKNVTGKMDLLNGRLSLPIKATMGGSTLGGVITVNGAASPAQVTVDLSSPTIDYADLFAFIDMKPLISGTAAASANLSMSGNSVHALASTTNGKIDVTSTNGTVSSAIARQISSALVELISPGGGDVLLNCLAARFVATNGVVRDNGILADTSVSTIQGKGGFNLGAETIDLGLLASAKGVGKYGNLLPGLHVGGTFSQPRFGVDQASVVTNVAGLLLGNKNGGGRTVPTVTAPAGQNACVYTLDHPAAAAPAAADASTHKPADQLKKMGGELLKGLFGK